MDDESALIARSQAGDLDAFNLLVDRYERQAYSLALRTLGDPDAAADAAQDAFISAWQNLKHLKGQNFRAWLLRIVINGCYDSLRARKRRPAQSLDQMLHDEEAPLELPDPAASPEDEALRLELQRAIQRGLETLPEDQRLALILVDVQGLDYEAAAQILRTQLGTIKSRLNRGRRKLRDWLKGQPELLGRRWRQYGEGESTTRRES